jgi:hypothetical protein
MKILYNPQRSDNRFIYTFANDVINVEYNVFDWITKEIFDEELEIFKDVEVWEVIESHYDTFDFSSMPDGKLDSVETHLPINPIISAERIDGELKVELINLIGKNATNEERFPDWIDV